VFLEVSHTPFYLAKQAEVYAQTLLRITRFRAVAAWKACAICWVNFGWAIGVLWPGGGVERMVTAICG
jgi:hypothetical protein